MKEADNKPVLASAPGRIGVVGRLAPSPTGVLHLGNARSLLAAWLSARAAGGRVVLRIEDLIAGPPGQIASVLRDLTWIGLDWDEPSELPGRVTAQSFDQSLANRADLIVQSARQAEYERLLAPLLAAGRVYPCVCTRRDIELAGRAPHAEDKAVAYPGTCRGRFDSVAAAQEWASLRQSPGGVALRLRVDDEPIHFDDAFHGPTTVDLGTDSGDIVVRRKDGSFAYMFAVVVDDDASGITEVVRGDDLLDCTAQQIVIRNALALHPPPGVVPAPPLSQPRWVHLPLVLGEDGRRLAKRNRSLHVQQLAAAGISAGRVRRWLVASLGLQAAGSLDDAQGLCDVAAGFEWSAVPVAPVHVTTAEWSAT